MNRITEITEALRYYDDQTCETNTQTFKELIAELKELQEICKASEYSENAYAYQWVSKRIQTILGK